MRSSESSNSPLVDRRQISTPTETAREALLWNYTVLGEAFGQLSDDAKAAHPEIPWQDPVRVRNRVVHGYWSVDLDVLITSARDDLPSFLGAVRAIDVEGLR